MVALILSYFLIAYLLVPGVIFRLAGIWVPLRFQRTRAEEVTFAAWICLLPLALALLLLIIVSGPPSAAAWQKLDEWFAGTYSGMKPTGPPFKFFTATWGVFLDQVGFLSIFYYPLVVSESVLFVVLVRKYGDWRERCPRYAWIVEQILLRGVNEWYVLLTDFALPKDKPHKVSVDILTQEDHLYRGDLAQYFIDTDGSLSGIFLGAPFRFDRAGYLRRKEQEPATKPDGYWKKIPGNTLYLPSTKVLSLNIAYHPMVEPETETAEKATEELRAMGLRVVVPLPSDLVSKDRPESE